MTKKEFFSAVELAKATGVSADTLRRYERKGVLRRPRRAANDYRQHPPEALAAVHEFPRFQIEDHRTGDPTEVKP